MINMDDSCNLWSQLSIIRMQRVSEKVVGFLRCQELAREGSAFSNQQAVKLTIFTTVNELMANRRSREKIA